MCNLGILLLMGAPGLPRDEKEGHVLILNAAERGHALAQFNLALAFGERETQIERRAANMVIVDAMGGRRGGDGREAGRRWEGGGAAMGGRRGGDGREAGRTGLEDT